MHYSWSLTNSFKISFDVLSYLLIVVLCFINVGFIVVVLSDILTAVDCVKYDNKG